MEDSRIVDLFFARDERAIAEAMQAYGEKLRRLPLGLGLNAQDAEELERFQAQGLDITLHRKKMNEITPDGKDIEDRFKDKDDSLCLVFVCAMWLTGFDVPSLSTLYLDKPMKSHTLMQAIARANRVFPGKPCGMVVDYVNVFKYMQQALADYANNGEKDEYPAKDVDQLLANIDSVVEETDAFLNSIDVSINEILATDDKETQHEMLLQAYDRLKQYDDWKERFRVYGNLLRNLYDASKPEVFERGWENEKFPPLNYLIGLYNNEIDEEKMRVARAEMAKILDQSVNSQAAEPATNYGIHKGKIIDLSKIDVEALERRISATPYKALELEEVKELIEKTLEQMIDKNCTRVSFSQRYRNIINRYNAGGMENNEYYEKLLQLIEDLKKEQGRHTEMDLKEEELEIYDLLIQGRKLTKAEEQNVILASKNLYNKLMEEKERLMVVDWYKDEQPRQQVYSLIQLSLNNDLPMSYDRIAFNEKTNLLLNHFVDMAVQGYGWIA